jgi:hypothetical protein
MLRPVMSCFPQTLTTTSLPERISSSLLPLRQRRIWSASACVKYSRSGGRSKRALVIGRAHAARASYRPGQLGAFGPLRVIFPPSRKQRIRAAGRGGRALCSVSGACGRLTSANAAGRQGLRTAFHHGGRHGVGKGWSRVPLCVNEDNCAALQLAGFNELRAVPQFAKFDFARPPRAGACDYRDDRY